MAFHHFHKHRSKYLAFFMVATLFSLMAFNITPALTSFSNSLFGGTSGAYVVFKTSGGVEVGITDAEWATTSAELPAARDIFRTVKGFDPFSSIANERDVVLAHHVFLAEAAELEIEMPPETAERVVDAFKVMLQQQQRQVALTVEHWAALLRRYRLNDESLRHRMLELLKVEAYVRTVRGVRVHDPDRMVQLFQEKHVKVGLDYVEFPFAKYRAELLAAPPCDADLETWFKELPQDVRDRKYKGGPWYTIDLVTIDADAWDPASAPADVIGAVKEPTDEELLAAVSGDRTRYRAGGAAPAAIADVTADERAKVVKDRQLQAALEQLRRDFDAAAAALPPPPASGTPEEIAAARADHLAKESAAFAEAVARYRFEVKTVVEQETAQLAALDPPKDALLGSFVAGLRIPGHTDSQQRTASVLAAAERKWAYVVRLAAEPKPSAERPFAEVKQQVLEQWADDKAKETAVGKAQALVDLLVAEGEQSPALPEATKAAFLAQRDDALKTVEADAEADAAAKKRGREGIANDHFFNLQAALRGALGARFGEVAQSLGLEVKSAGPQRRSLSTTWYYNDRFSGAERFLFRQTNDPNDAVLLAFAEGGMSRVLVDDAGQAAYVAKVASRQLPTLDEMTPKDRKEVEDEEKFEWLRLDSPELLRRFSSALLPQLPPYADLFSIAQILHRHEPRVRATTQPQDDGGGGGFYGYGY